MGKLDISGLNMIFFLVIRMTKSSNGNCEESQCSFPEKLKGGLLEAVKSDVIVEKLLDSDLNIPHFTTLYKEPKESIFLQP